MENGSQASRYWYGSTEEDRRRRAVEVLQAFRVYRAAEVAMRRVGIILGSLVQGYGR